MKRIVRIKKNVRVSFDDSSRESYPKAKLQYRVKLLFLLHRWVTVNLVYYAHYSSYGFDINWTPSDMIKTLLKEGIRNKCTKLNRRAFNRKINEHK